MLLILAALAMTVIAGCGGSPQTSEKPSAEKRASGTANPTEQKPESTGTKEEDAQGDKLGHPYLGSADAPVVLTEYSDYQ